MLKVITMRVVMDEVSYAVSKDPHKKRILVNFETLEEKDGMFFVKTATPVRETNISTNEC